jgi:hypothetical protein
MIVFWRNAHQSKRGNVRMVSVVVPATGAGRFCDPLFGGGGCVQSVHTPL